MSTKHRRRLAPDRRRAELLDIGAQFFAAHPYEEVLMEDVAARAGASRALVYHYFPTKREFFTAIFNRDSERLIAVSAIEPGMPLAEQVLAGLGAHLDYFTANRQTILTVNRGALAGDPRIQAIISEQLAALRNSLLAGLDPPGESRDRLRVALDGWLAFIRAVCVEWLRGAALSRSDILELCLETLTAIIAPYCELEWGRS